MQRGELTEIIAYIEKHFVFNEGKYPELKGASEKYLFEYAVRHIALHLAKFGGKIAAISEDVDHGGAGDIAELKQTVPKTLIAVLRLASLLKVTEDDLLRAIEEKYKAPLD